LRLLNGHAFKKSQWSTKGLPIVRIQNLKSPEANFNHFDGLLPDKYRARTGDLLFAWSGTPGTSFGAHIWTGGDAWINQHIFRVDYPADLFTAKFLRLALNRNLQDYIEEAQGGVGLAHITKSKLDDSRLAVPPLPEQRRLVGRIENIEVRRYSAASHLERARFAIARFRQAILAAAYSGRLSAGWREVNSVTADSLANALASSASHSKKPIAQPDTDFSGEIPADWRLVSLDLLIKRIEAGRSFKAEGRPARSDEWGVIKVSAMSWGRFLEEENKAVLSHREVNPAYEIRAGDLLISRANTAELVGATVLVGGTRSKLLLSDKSLRLVPRPGVDKAWLNYALRSSFVRAQFAERATGTSDSMRNLSQDKILSTALPLPSTTEQVVIARRAETLLELADAIEARIEDAARRVEISKHATLIKAFRGALVPTEADRSVREGRDYEPTAVLLQRLTGQTPPASKRGGRRTRE